MALHTHVFCIQWFNQLQMRNIKKKKLQKVQERKTKMCSTSNYLHRIYITLGIVSNLERSWSIQESICMLCANTNAILYEEVENLGTWYLGGFWNHSPVQFSSVAQSCPTLCNPMDCSMPGLPVHHQLQEFTQMYVHWVCDAIQPSHPLSSPSLPTFNLSQHQGLFKWVSSSHQVTKVLEFQL